MPEPESPNIIEIIQRVQREIQTLRGSAHILTPMARTKIDSVAAGKIPVLRVAAISPDPKDGEVYAIKQLPGKFALSKVGLMRLEAMAGITGWTSRVETIDGDPLKVKATAYAEIEDIDGTIRGKPQTFVLDLNDGSAQAKKANSPADLAQQRVNIVPLAESKAMNRVRRDLLNLQAAFTQEELKKPFVIMRLVDAPLDASDPLIKKLLIMKQLKITSEMYESAVASLPASHERPITSLPPASVRELPPASVETPQGPSPEETQAAMRADLIAEVDELYRRKVRGGRAASKPPLSSLTDQELNQIKEMLLERQDIT